MFSIISLVAFVQGLIYRLSYVCRSFTKPMAPTRICVFCAASAGNDPVHLEAARSLAQAMHDHNIQLVYGGSTTGMMGELAKTLVKLSGKESVHGIIPSSMLTLERPGKDKGQKLPKKWSRRMGLGGLAQLQEAKEYDNEFGSTIIVKDLQVRKKMMMMELVLDGGNGSGFVGLSGGFGTMDEVMEVVSWRQMGIHDRGVVLYNVDGYWDGVMSWMERGIKDGFVKEKGRDFLVQRGDAEGVVKWLKEVAKK